MRNKRWRRWGLAVALPLALALNVFVLSAIASMNRTASERGPDLAASIEMLNIEPPEILETEEVEEETPPEEPEPLDLDLDLAPPEMTMSADLDDPLLDLDLPSIAPTAMRVVVRQRGDPNADARNVGQQAPAAVQLRSDAVDVPPRELSSNRQPRYPRSALRQKVEGMVRVDLLISEEGRVLEVKLVEGDSPFREAVLDVVRRWRFTPPKDQGRPVQVWGLKTFHFNLPRR